MVFYCMVLQTLSADCLRHRGFHTYRGRLEATRGSREAHLLCPVVALCGDLLADASRHLPDSMAVHGTDYVPQVWSKLQAYRIT